jgi:DNA repair exonuclease SbcCD ATPase subunit
MIREHLETMMSGPDASNRLRSEERRLRDRINGLRNDASTIENNMAFFANSKGANADQIRKQFIEKKTALEQQIQRLEKELKMLRSMKPGNA